MRRSSERMGISSISPRSDLSFLGISMQQVSKVLYVMDDEPDSARKLKPVLAMAEAQRWHLTLFGVVESIGASSRMLVTCLPLHQLKARAVEKRLSQIEALIDIIRHDSCRLRGRSAFGNRAREIIREAESGQYDLVIKHWADEPVDKKLQRKSRLPIWLLKPDDITASDEIIASSAPGFTADRRI